MTYISRRLLLTNENGENVEVADTDFFKLNAPLIILGEPGSGKSELVKEYKNNSGSKLYNASSIDTFPTINMEMPPAKTIIDGIDEVTAYGTGATITKILSKLNNHDFPRFVLTCRVVDWQDAVNTSIIQERWNQKPLTGKILPLNDQEIVKFVNANGNGEDGEKFIQEAQRRDVIDLLKNPQNLTLLLKAIQNDGWPDTRFQLYENASLAIIQEHNKKHESLNTGKYATNKLIDTAGFIFAQLLLSGKTSVFIDVKEGSNTSEIIDFVCDDYDESIIRSTLSTKIFRISGNTVLEACHRTVAEFLAAKWLSKALGNHLSLARLESLLYGSNFIVPAALRGLHAWLATLTPKIAERLITRDPYGFFRYGDPSVLDISQSRILLRSLEKIAEIDPYFRSEDWHATFGHGLARLELRDDIIRLIRNPESSYQLSHLIIESIKGDDFSNVITDDLLELLVDISATYIERFTAFEVLAENNTQPDWVEIVEKLRTFGDVESLRIAIEIIQINIKNFSGMIIAGVLNEITEAIDNEDSHHYAGIGSRIEEEMTIQQLEESLQFFSENSHEHNKADEWKFSFLQQRFKKGALPSASVVWSWLKMRESHSYYRSEWDKYSIEYFSQNPKSRQSIQAEAIQTAPDTEALRLTFWKIREASDGLWLRENDFILHMTSLISEKNKYADWHLRWKELVSRIMMHSDFTGSAMNLVREQASKSKILQEQLIYLERPPLRDYEEEERARKLQKELQIKEQARIRHESYEAIKEQLNTGQRIDVLHEVAGAYLGRYNNISGDTPLDRVTTLVGKDLVELVLEGIASASLRNDIPTSQKMTELHAKESKVSFFESILLTYCAILIDRKIHLEELPFSTATSALAACQWGLHFSNDEITPEVQKQLESIVFNDNDSIMNFIRDTIEPYLESNAEYISGLYRVVTEEMFSGVAGELAIQWIIKYEKLSANILHQLLIAIIQHGPREELITLVRERISNDKWNNEEQRHAWFGTAFLLDFEYHNDVLSQYADEGKERLWALRSMIKSDRNQKKYWPKINELQNYFLITKFGTLWPPAEFPSGGSSGDKNPWDASNFIFKRISDLAAILSDQAEGLLKSLQNKSELEGYQNHIKHLIAQQTRDRAEENKKLLPLNRVRKILLQQEPANIDDLQALLIDELNNLQNRVSNSPTNEIAPFWNNDEPHDENYCRDRITEKLTPYMDKYNVRMHTEGSMPNNKRCDLLNTYKMIDLPIEIKGQWHSDIWTAATEQLLNYTREYRADGRGIFLILWFGYLGANNSKNPHGWRGQKLPKSLDELHKILSTRYANISEKTKIFVLDLSNH